MCGILKTKVSVYKFRIGDVEDPNIAASFAIEEWTKTNPVGQWIERTGHPITCNWHWDEGRMCYSYSLVAVLPQKDYTYYCLIKDNNGN